MEINVTEEMIREVSEREIAKYVAKWFNDIDDHAKTHYHTNFQQKLEASFEKIIKEQYKEIVMETAKKIIPDKFSGMLANAFLERLQDTSMEEYPDHEGWDD
jgi:translation initiation factor 2B subunit (eIF-2B alpha/beta/delta family)